MAKRKQADEPPKGGWISTFSDLMNLLLCFFIMLFAMSTIDETKFEELVRSLQESIGVMSGISDSVLDGSMVTAGTQALMELTNAYEEKGINDFENSESVIDKGQGDHDYSPIDDDATMKKDEMTEAEMQEALEEAGKKESEEMAEDISKQLEEAGVQEEVEIATNAQYVEITLDGAMLFDSGNANFNDSALPIINKVGSVLEHYADYDIEIIGHTDSVPIVSFSVYADNLDLSFARAKSVAMYLINNNNLSISNITFSGRGEYEPVASNDTEEGRAQNRRVEVRIYNKIATETMENSAESLNV